MNEETDPLALTVAALDLARMMEAEHLDGAFVGAFAAGFVSEPRATRDIDAMVFWEERRPEELAGLATKYGFELRSENSMDIARRSRVLLLVHRSTGVTADISLGILPFELNMARRAIRHERNGVLLPIATAEDLFIMKVLAGREKDIFDLQQIARANPNLDSKYVLSNVAEMAELLEIPEMNTLAKGILKQVP
ncbi:MAG TPA: hypothetical protein VMI31_07445 [Fimbriimonadaceae bacterium]|nr:hypothetical protein [Fimbriimonadaceae bacterium]